MSTLEHHRDHRDHQQDNAKLGHLSALTFDNITEVCLAGDLRAYDSLNVALIGAGNDAASKARAAALRDVVHTKIFARSYIQGDFASSIDKLTTWYTEEKTQEDAGGTAGGPPDDDAAEPRSKAIKMVIAGGGRTGH